MKTGSSKGYAGRLPANEVDSGASKPVGELGPGRRLLDNDVEAPPPRWELVKDSQSSCSALRPAAEEIDISAQD
jgi:hypothetical protein